MKSLIRVFEKTLEEYASASPLSAERNILFGQLLGMKVALSHCVEDGMFNETYIMLDKMMKDAEGNNN